MAAFLVTGSCRNVPRVSQYHFPRTSLLSHSVSSLGGAKGMFIYSTIEAKIPLLNSLILLILHFRPPCDDTICEEAETTTSRRANSHCAELWRGPSLALVPLPSMLSKHASCSLMWVSPFILSFIYFTFIFCPYFILLSHNALTASCGNWLLLMLGFQTKDHEGSNISPCRLVMGFPYASKNRTRAPRLNCLFSLYCLILHSSLYLFRDFSSFWLWR